MGSFDEEFDIAFDIVVSTPVEEEVIPSPVICLEEHRIFCTKENTCKSWKVIRSAYVPAITVCFYDLDLNARFN